AARGQLYDRAERAAAVRADDGDERLLDARDDAAPELSKPVVTDANGASPRGRRARVQIARRHRSPRRTGVEERGRHGSAVDRAECSAVVLSAAEQRPRRVDRARVHVADAEALYG